ncbi:MAG: DUF1836 domain-containing protein, partial [Longicatena sp.]
MSERRNTPVIQLPHWDQLPDMELYMDQVVTLLNDYLKPFQKGQD